MIRLILNIIEKLIQSFKFKRIKRSLKKQSKKLRTIKKPLEGSEKDLHNDELEEQKYFSAVISKEMPKDKDDKEKAKTKKKSTSNNSNDNKKIENKKIENKKIEDEKIKDEKIKDEKDNKDIESFDIRKEPDSKSRKIGTIKKDAKYKKLKSVPHWIKISYNGKEGYLSKISANKMDS